MSADTDTEPEIAQPWSRRGGGRCAGARTLLALSVFFLLALTACDGSVDRKEKTALSALWIAAESRPLEASDTVHLQAAGIEEALIEAGTFDPAADPPIRRASDLPAAVNLPAHLVIGGSWERSIDTAAAAVLGRDTAEAARQYRFELESQGWLVVGVVLDLEEIAGSVAQAEAYGAFLRAFHGELKELYLSAVVPRKLALAATKEDDAGETATASLEAIAAGVDFLIPFLYGQRADEPEDPRAWDFGLVEAELRVIDKLGVPYVLGVGILGTAYHLNPENQVIDRTTELTVADVMSDRDMRMRPSFTLRGGDRRVYTLDAEDSARVGPWELRKDEAVRLVRTATYDMEELTRLLDTWPLENLLGQVYYRLPGAREGLSLGLSSLVEARDAGPATPELVFDVAVQRRSGRGWLLRFVVENLNEEFTELAFSNYNYIQITSEQGRFASEQDPGDFYRYELHRQLEDGELKRTMHKADVLRLHSPIVEAGQAVRSGDILLQAGGLALRLDGLFLLPDGRQIEIGPAFFRNGELTGEDVKG